MNTVTIQRQRCAVSISREVTASFDACLTISTQHEDREGDILVSEGAVLDAYRKNPVVLFSHDHYSIPVGRTTSIAVVPNVGIRADFVWLRNDPTADRVRNAFDQGVLNAASVGFRPLKWEPLGSHGYRYTKWELLEWSIVAVPANAEATRVLKSLGLGGNHAPLIISETALRRAVAEGVNEGFASAGRDTRELVIDETAVRRAVEEGVAAVSDKFRKITGRLAR